MPRHDHVETTPQPTRRRGRASALPLLAPALLVASLVACDPPPRTPIMVTPRAPAEPASDALPATAASDAADGGVAATGAGAAGALAMDVEPDARAAAGAAGSAAEASCDAERAPSFEVDVAPILRAGCTGCHDDAGAARLDLRSHAGVMAGGAHGAVVVAGDCEASALWSKTGEMPPFGGRMPADGPPWLSDAQRATLCDWILAGAPARVLPCSDSDDPTAPVDAGTGAAGAGPIGTLADTTPPEFDGLEDVDEVAGGCLLRWDAARDDVTPGAGIFYEVYVAAVDDPFPDVPQLVTQPGVTSVRIELAAGEHDVRVLAVDEAGNRDDNDRVRECAPEAG